MGWLKNNLKEESITERPKEVCLTLQIFVLQMNLTLLLLSPLVIASSTKFESVRNFSRSIIITCIVLIDDTMKRSEEFMTKAYK